MHPILKDILAVIAGILAESTVNKGIIRIAVYYRGFSEPGGRLE
jgi:hypothetical protein